MHTATPRRFLVHALAATVVSLAAATPSVAQITFYEHDGYQGRNFTTQANVPDLQRRGFNDRASSAVVGSQQWEICEDTAFQGSCRVLRPGQYASLAAMGLNDRVSSVRAVSRSARVDDERYAPAPAVTGDFRRRGEERLFEAPVTSSRAVFGTPAQRCWVEREEVPVSSNQPHVPGAIIGAVLGGILGHQIGGGTGRDIATAGGVVAGAVVGSKVGRKREGNVADTRDVQRCADAPGAARPAYWDVTYKYRGQEHRVQLTAAPGPTVTVNRRGEPRT